MTNDCACAPHKKLLIALRKQMFLPLQMQAAALYCTELACDAKGDVEKNSATVTKGSAAVVKALPLIFLKVSAHMGSTSSASKLLSSPSVDDVLDANLPFSFTTCWRCAFLAHVALATESPFVSRKMCCVAPELLRTNCFEKNIIQINN